MQEVAPSRWLLISAPPDITAHVSMRQGTVWHTTNLRVTMYLEVQDTRCAGESNPHFIHLVVALLWPPPRHPSMIPPFHLFPTSFHVFISPWLPCAMKAQRSI